MIERVTCSSPAWPSLRRLRSKQSAEPSITRNPTKARRKLVESVATRKTTPATNPKPDHFIRRTVWG